MVVDNDLLNAIILLQIYDKCLNYEKLFKIIFTQVLFSYLAPPNLAPPKPTRRIFLQLQVTRLIFITKGRNLVPAFCLSKLIPIIS